MTVWVVLRINGETCHDEFAGVFDMRITALAYMRASRWRPQELEIVEWAMNRGAPDPDPHAEPIARILAETDGGRNA